MNEILAYAMPGGMMLAGMLSIIVGFGAVLVWPRYLMFAFIACMLVLASSSGYGYADASDSNVFWVKGSRTFFFTFIEMSLVGAWLAMLYRHAWQGRQAPWLPMSKFYIGLAVLLFGHCVVGLMTTDHSLLEDLSMRGFTGVLYQGMFVALVLSTVRTERDLKLMATLFLVCLAGRHVFGLVRYIAFGGDPQNVYSVLGTSPVNITFFDINDSILAAAMFALCLWRLLTEGVQTLGPRLLLTGGMFMAFLTPLLSARRTAQAGMLLAIVALVPLLPRGRRWLAAAALVLAMPVVLYTLTKRLDTPGASIADRVLIDIKTNPLADPRRSRFHELTTAWQTIKESPMFGLGPAGSFKVYDRIGLEYHGGRYDFVHSGFGHVLLKGGFVGLALFCGVLLSWALYVRRYWAVVQGPPQTLAVAALAGLAASVPNLLFGTPVAEIRTMLVMGLLMALPLVAIRLARAQLADGRVTAPASTRAGAAQVSGLRQRGAAWQ